MVVVCQNAKNASTADFAGYVDLNYEKFKFYMP
jgi:hypothetical protein